jgi:hypothetical protein
MEFCRHENAFSLIGNHEHAHVGGPVVSKFHDDEAAVLEQRLGPRAEQVRRFFAELPLIAVSESGVVLTHGAPRGTEPDLESFESLSYGGYEDVSIHDMYQRDTVGALLWARGASPQHAQDLLRVACPHLDGKGFVAYGHDIVRDGFEMVADEQLCLSTSFGLFDECKYFLRLELGGRYETVRQLEIGRELRRLHPDARRAPQTRQKIGRYGVS